MSEYQYYEFRAVDRPLTDEEMRAVRAFSTRADITPTRFVNEYNWGDFKGRPREWMERWYDAFLYLANWGTRELMLRLPRTSLDPEAARPYCPGHTAEVTATPDFVILSFLSDQEAEDGDWAEDGSGLISSILPLRAELDGGDQRALYLGWLLAAQSDLDDDEPEPPVPPGLGSLSPALVAFADFLRIDPDLVRVAAERSPPMSAGPDDGALPGWIAALPEAEKTELLVRVTGDEGMSVRAELLRRFRQAHRPDSTPAVGARTVGELLEAAERAAEERSRAEAERKAREKALRDREAAAQRERYLDTIAGQEPEMWRKVDELVESRLPAAYDEAVQLLADLRALGTRGGESDEVEAQIDALRQRHARKSSFIQRLARIKR